MMIHHVKEIQMRFLAVVAVLIAGMVVGYIFYEPLFAFIKAPLHGPLHYMSPVGSFSFIIKICLMTGIVAALPVAVYNFIMFVQPALSARLSRARVYATTFFSLLLATSGAAFAFFVILPLALRFFYKFKVDGLVALISADDYFRFVVNVVITFVVIFQLPLIISVIDHITPLPPRKLLKFEKFIIIGSVLIAVVVPFALDPTVQLLIASPIIILYNVAIVVVLLQHRARTQRLKRAERVAAAEKAKMPAPLMPPLPESLSLATEPTPEPEPMPVPEPAAPVVPKPHPATPTVRKTVRKSMDGTIRRVKTKPAAPLSKARFISDIRPARRPPLPATRPQETPE